MPRPMRVCLCGSTRFKDEFLAVNESLTLDGHIVLMPGVFGHADGLELSDYDKQKLDNLHKAKIIMSDAVVVINKDGYIGQSTQLEIEYAELFKIPVYYMEEKE